MSKVTCNIQRANESNHVTPSTCHALIYNAQFFESEEYVEVEWLVIASTDPENVKKRIRRRYYMNYQGKPNSSFDKALKVISIACGSLTQAVFDKCAKNKTNPDIDLDDWLGRQCVLVVEAQKDKPQFSQVAAIYSVDDEEASGCPFDTEAREEIRKDPSVGIDMLDAYADESGF